MKKVMIFLVFLALLLPMAAWLPGQGSEDAIQYEIWVSLDPAKRCCAEGRPSLDQHQPRRHPRSVVPPLLERL